MSERAEVRMRIDPELYAALRRLVDGDPGRMSLTSLLEAIGEYLIHLEAEGHAPGGVIQLPDAIDPRPIVRRAREIADGRRRRGVP